MTTPNLLRGGLYPTVHRSGCPRFHACTLTKKCQNFNRHDHACVVCESRVRPNPIVGGFLAEGEVMPDLQHAMAIMSRRLHTPFVDPEGRGQKIDHAEIANANESTRRAADMFKHFYKRGDATMDRHATDAYFDTARRRFVGRIE